MKVFHCDHCRQLLFFENTKCLGCGRVLAFLPDLDVVGSLDPAGEGLWRSPIARAAGRIYRLCPNYAGENICNWAVNVDDQHSHCISCRLTRKLPNLQILENRQAWCRVETAKRRLIYTLMHLGAPIVSKVDDPERGLAYDLLSNAEQPKDAPVLTGHNEGVITINLAEADDVQRERIRVQMHEPYRTLLGHFRHEIGHYYWDRLIRDSSSLETYRRLFGDDRQDYEQALAKHYNEGAPADWQEHFISAYASTHPWEDWAETWAHYLHMIDALETASSCGLALRPRRENEPEMKPAEPQEMSFDHMIDRWFALTYVLNNLNRGLGLADAYPFILPNQVVEKLRFIHDVLAGIGKGIELTSHQRLQVAPMVVQPLLAGSVK
jgi:hypothetical protein